MTDPMLASSREAALERELERVRDELAEAQATVRALVSGEVDAVIGEVGGVASEPIALRRAQAELREQTSMLRGIIASSPAAIMLIDVEGKIQLWNEAATRLFGWTADEVLGRPVPTMSAEERDRVVAETRGGLSCQGQLVRRVRKDGGSVAVSLSKAPVHDAKGAIRGAVGVLVDMTEQQALEDKLRQSERMESVGTLAGGVAHDFNNMLSAIRGFADVLKENVGIGDPMHDDLDEIVRATERAAELTRKLLAFGRKQALSPTVFRVDALIGDMTRMLRRMIREDVQVVLRPGCGDLCVYADTGQLEQVIVNLVVNARDAMPEGGTVTITTAPVVFDEAASRERGGLPPGPYLRIAVADTGTGMEPAVLERIFEPFFTTKEKGRGTGLGLATVYGIVKQSGGHVEARSTPGAGSVFEVYLPEHAPDDRATTNTSSRPPTLAGTETILVVEDEDLVRKLVVRVLRRAGYHVLEAANAGEALLADESHPGPVQLLVSDVVMPRVGGPELAKRLAERRPDMRVLFMSGYSEEELGNPRSVLLPKPFSPRQLLAEVRRLLDEG